MIISYFKLQYPDVVGGHCDGKGHDHHEQERDKRLHIIHQALDKRITQEKAAELIGLSSRQLRRIVMRVRAEGDDGISHRSRGKTSNRRVLKKIKDKALKLFREKYSDFGPTFASEKFLDVHEIKVSKARCRN